MEDITFADLKVGETFVIVGYEHVLLRKFDDFKAFNMSYDGFNYVLPQKKVVRTSDKTSKRYVQVIKLQKGR